MSGLRIAPELALPVEVAGEAIAILAKRGAGKTNTATVLVEEIYKAGIQVVILDPVGAWWGIRSSADGDHEGLAIAVLGGVHGDVPLDQAAGALIADVAVDSGQSLLLDLSDFPSKASMARFVVDFGERLFRRKNRDKSLLHLVLEEADTFAPQTGKGDDARMRGAIEQIVRRGRSRGIGLTMITQRSAVLNKDVLSQADVLIPMRTTSPHDTAAIKQWVAAHGDDEHGVIASLPSLETGEAWFWNPERGLLQRVMVRRRETFDSSSTPTAGKQRSEPKRLAAFDVNKLGVQIQATAERAKENDPTELRKKLREIERELEAQKVATDTLARRRDDLERFIEERPAEERVVEVSPIDALELDELLNQLRDVKDLASSAVSRIDEGIRQAVLLAGKVRALPPASGERAERGTLRPDAVRDERAPRPVPPRPAVPRPTARQTPVDGVEVSGPQRRILNALAALEQIGLRNGASKIQVALFAQASPNSSSYTNNLGALKNDKGLNPWPPLISYPAAKLVTLTDEGRAIADPHAAPTSAEEMHAYVYRLVTGPQARILQELIAVYPQSLEREELAERVAASPTSSSYTNNLGALRSLGLIDKQPGVVSALPILFMDA